MVRLFSHEGTTQGNPLAMAMYAISTMPVIQCLNHPVQQVWYADDATALFVAKLVEQAANCQGKTNMSPATDLFHKVGIQITPQGRRHLGAALDSRSFIEEYVTSKVAS